MKVKPQVKNTTVEVWEKAANIALLILRGVEQPIIVYRVSVRVFDISQ